MKLLKYPITLLSLFLCIQTGQADTPDNPASRHWYNRNDSSRHKADNRIELSLLTETTDGDYIYYHGKTHQSGTIRALGQKHYEHIGTVYGEAMYGRSVRTRVNYNYAINPEIYSPYLSCDTLGNAPYHYEHYLIKGGYGFRIRQTFLGLEGSYEGCVAARTREPKASAYDSWIRFKASIARQWRHTLYSLQVSPEINNQHITVGSYRNLPVKFFQFYGFGNWNRKESKAGYTMGRKLSVNGIGTEFSIHHTASATTMLALSAGYRFRRMKTEEDSYKNLFTKNSQSVYLKTSVHGKQKGFEYDIRLLNILNLQNGIENVYENLVVSEEHNLYNYQKIGENRLYSSRTSLHRLQTCLRILFYKGFLHVSPQLTCDSYLESYQSPHRLISNLSLSPQIGFGGGYISSRHAFECTLSVAGKLPVHNTFDLPETTSSSFFREQVLIPYEIRKEKNFSSQFETTYQYRLDNTHQIGCALSALLLQRINETDLSYPCKRNYFRGEFRLYYRF